MYLGKSLIHFSIAVACTSWLILVMSVLAFGFKYSQVMLEERSCLGEYGTAYLQYMRRTPRWLGIPRA
jgi:protein-S-isoprenylcysteine O-methyltransferase Ste14